MFLPLLKNILKLSVVWILFVFMSLVSCEKIDTPDPTTAEEDSLNVHKTFLYQIMNHYYYWYKQIPSNIDPKPIKTIESYFDTLLIAQDRWSWMMTGEEYVQSETGVYESYGISLGQPIDYFNDYSVRVRYVHPSSPMSENNVKRGYQLTHLNGTAVNTLISNGTFNSVYGQSSNSFTFKNYSGQSFTFSTSSRVISTRSYLKKMVITQQDYQGLPYNVGYFNYLSFKAGMLEDIDSAMEQFKNDNIRVLILDLRYNSGGDTRATALLANYIAPASANGKILVKREHNDKLRSLDNDVKTQTIISRIAGSLNLDHLFVLTTKGSASASEVIINGLNPLMSVIQVGSTTYGKPNGMYVLTYPYANYDNPKYVFLPVCFFSVNSIGYGQYLNGLTPDHYRPDDLYHDFGLTDDWVQSVLHYVTNGSFPPLPVKSQTAHPFSPALKITTDEDNTGYGVFKSHLPSH